MIVIGILVLNKYQIYLTGMTKAVITLVNVGCWRPLWQECQNKGDLLSQACPLLYITEVIGKPG